MMALSDSKRIHKNRLARMRNIKTASLKKLYESGEIVRAYAQKKIREGAISGPGHIPGAPGDFPNANTHETDIGIDVRLNASRLSVSVVSTVKWSAALEFGHSRAEARPFMRPSLQANRNRIVLGQVQAVKELARVYKSDTAFSNARTRYENRDE